MSMVETTPVTVAPGGDDRWRAARRRRRLVVLAVVLVAAVMAAWVRLTTPHLEGGGVLGVRSEDHEVVVGHGLDELVYVVPAGSRGSTTLALGVRNAGRLPVELVDVWPSTADPGCVWQPTTRRYQDDPRLIGVLDEQTPLLADAVLAPGRSATVWLTGAHTDTDDCRHAGFTLHHDAEVVVRIGGRVSSTRVPLGYTFGYADEPETLRDSYGVEVRPPSDQAAR